MAEKYDVLIGDKDSPDCRFTSTDESLIDLTGVLSVDVAGDKLAIDQLTPVVKYPFNERSAEPMSGADFSCVVSSDGYVLCSSRVFGDLRLTPYGTKVFAFQNAVLIAKMYSEYVDHSAKEQYGIHAVSPVGLLARREHNGGLYEGELIPEILAELIGDAFPYSVSPAVASTQVFGWLRKTNDAWKARDNLHELMFAEGLSLTKDENGDPVFDFLTAAAPESIADNSIYDIGSLNYETPATAVDVTEHTYTALVSDERVTLFDNISDVSELADHTMVTFQDAPIHDLIADGLTVHESNCNYAIVSGVGTLTGQKYAHFTRIVRHEAEDPVGEPNVIPITGRTLVSVANSENVAARLLAFYSSHKTARNSIVYSGQRCGRQYELSDPYNGQMTGFLTSMELTMSNTTKADCTWVTDYTPTSGGNNYTESDLVTASGPWTAKKTGKHRIVICSGGQGGHGGYGGAGSSHNGEGKGGTSAPGGDGGRVLSFTLDLTEGDTLTIAIGAGGTAGAVGAVGSLGADTTVAINGEIIYTTADGEITPYGVVDIFSGDTYAMSGANGIAGADGGAHYAKGGDVSYGGQTWTGGANFVGAGGGGAAYGNNGGVGRAIYDDDELDGYKGGNGATAERLVEAAGLGCGGRAGNSGGGGGYGMANGPFWTSLYGYGGAGTAGNDGGAGFALIYS